MTTKKKLQFLDLYRMVLADGIVHPKEIETLYRIGIVNYGLTEDEITDGIKTAGFSSAIPESPEEKIAVLYEMAQIAWADGELVDSERNMLRRYATMYGINDEHIDGIVDFLLDRAHKGVDEKEVINELKG